MFGFSVLLRASSIGFNWHLEMAPKSGTKQSMEHWYYDASGYFQPYFELCANPKWQNICKICSQLMRLRAHKHDLFFGVSWLCVVNIPGMRNLDQPYQPYQPYPGCWSTLIETVIYWHVSTGFRLLYDTEKTHTVQYSLYIMIRYGLPGACSS